MKMIYVKQIIQIALYQKGKKIRKISKIFERKINGLNVTNVNEKSKILNFFTTNNDANSSFLVDSKKMIYSHKTSTKRIQRKIYENAVTRDISKSN